IQNFSGSFELSAEVVKVRRSFQRFRWSCKSSAGFSDSAQKFLIFRLRIEIFGGRSRSSARVSKCQPDRFIFCGTFEFSAKCPDCSEEVLVFGEASYFFPLNLFDLLQNSSSETNALRRTRLSY